MSRSQKDDFAQNPATRFFEWQGGTGGVTYYDREKKENIEVKLPFRFLVLDEVMTVGGGVDNNDGYVGFWSNAIRSRDAKTKHITVRSNSNGRKRIEYTGTWADIKANLVGAKYIKGLYIGYYNDDKQLDIGYLKIKGAALMPWVNFNEKRRDVTVGAFSIVGQNEAKKGKNVYYEPAFEWTDNVKPETEDAAIALDVTLQAYLREYFAQDATAEPVHSETEYTGVDAPPDTTQDPPEYLSDDDYRRPSDPDDSDDVAF